MAQRTRVKKNTENIIDSAVARQKTLHRGGFLNPKYWAKAMGGLMFAKQPEPAPAPKGRGRKAAAKPAPAPKKLSAAGWLILAMGTAAAVYFIIPRRHESVSDLIRRDEEPRNIEIQSDEPAARQPEPQAQSGDREHIVARGDWLSLIAERYYGDIKAYKMLQRVNGLENPDLLEPGQVIRVPKR